MSRSREGMYFFFPKGKEKYPIWLRKITWFWEEIKKLMVKGRWNIKPGCKIVGKNWITQKEIRNWQYSENFN